MDRTPSQMVVEDLLIPLGYVVTCAMDGVEGLEILASRDYLPDLILLDVQMPLMTGYEVTDAMSTNTSVFSYKNTSTGLRRDTEAVSGKPSDYHDQCES